jgi:repressor LexA
MFANNVGMAITRRQREVYDFISRFVAEHQYSPSFEEIGKGLELTSLATVHKHVTNLEKKGLLTRDYNRSRSIDLLPPKGRLKQAMSVNTAVVLPLVGRIAAGQPIEAVQTNETISLADFVRSKEVFVLEVRGDSMQDEAILDGDYVLVEKARTAHNGDIVVALVDSSDAEALLPGRRQHPAAALEREHEADHCAGRVSGCAGAGDWGAKEVLRSASG